MTIRWITDEERRRAAEAARDRAEREQVEWAFVHWVEAHAEPRADGRRTFTVPPLSEEMMTRLRALLCEEKP